MSKGTCAVLLGIVTNSEIIINDSYLTEVLCSVKAHTINKKEEAFLQKQSSNTANWA